MCHQEDDFGTARPWLCFKTTEKESIYTQNYKKQYQSVGCRLTAADILGSFQDDIN